MASSLSTATGSRPPPLTSAGLFLPATPSLKQSMRSAPSKETKPPEERCSWRAQGVSPVFRAALVQTFAALAFHSVPGG